MKETENYPDASPLVLEQGEHLGYQWRVTHNMLGFRCGYVAIPTTHPWFGHGYDEIEEAEVHGGLTYAHKIADTWWIGFDCAHCDDAQDTNLPMRVPLVSFRQGTVWTTEMVKAECLRLCEQAKEKELCNSQQPNPPSPANL